MPNSDPTEPRWTCTNGHSVPANQSQCGICGAPR